MSAGHPPAAGAHPPTGPGRHADAPLNLLDVLGTGFPVRNDNTTTPAYLGSGDGTSPPETYLAVHPSSATSTSLIKPGGSILIKNKQVGVGARQGRRDTPAAGSWCTRAGLCICRLQVAALQSAHLAAVARAPLPPVPC
jgi:hypothetical protein